jgi:diphosphomevalonate decarboxylase
MKARAWAPINVALIKYWGRSNESLRIPVNSSLSICLTRTGTETEVELVDSLKEDEVKIDGERVEGRERERVVKQLNRVRKMAQVKQKVRVRSKNNFPKGVGLSSSASGMAALSLAASRAMGLSLNHKDLSRLARVGSGSACRSVPDGWVEWVKGNNDKTSYAQKLFPADYWDLRVLVIILSQKEKKVSSSDGQKIAQTSAFFEERIKGIDNKMKRLKEAIKKKEFKTAGEIMEEDSLSMHSVMLTSKPSLIYWLPETLRVIQAVQGWREKGLESYFTINTGQNVFVVCKPKDEDKLVKRLEKIKGVIEVKKEKIGNGARLLA